MESLTQIAANPQKIVFLSFEASGVMGSIAAMKELFDPAAPRPVPKPPPTVPPK